MRKGNSHALFGQLMMHQDYESLFFAHSFLFFSKAFRAFARSFSFKRPSPSLSYFFSISSMTREEFMENMGELRLFHVLDKELFSWKGFHEIIWCKPFHFVVKSIQCSCNVQVAL